MKKIAQFSKMKVLLTVALLVCAASICQAQNKKNSTKILPGAERMDKYLPYLKNKRVAVFANQTSTVGESHLVDTLLALGIKVVRIFGPEHGFRGTADAGEHVDDLKDEKTGIPVVSLYGNHKMPTAKDFEGIDILIFDIQDVGTRFYTYISSLEFFMEGAILQHKPLLILDRPNPHGFYVDGPVMQPAFRSFVGQQTIPVVYGMTIGEYALMLAGEKWLSAEANAIHKINCATKLTADTPFYLMVIKCEGYDHNSRPVLPVNPSPNLKGMESILWFPSTCFFEGTVFSEGRGTDKPFVYFGHPTLPKSMFSFTPKPNAGAKSSKCFYQQCYGWDLSAAPDEIIAQLDGKIQIKYLLEAYRLFPGKDSFFLKNNFFNKLAGNATFQQQIKDGLTETAIRKSWEPGIKQFKAIRKKYLLYKDFE